MEALGTTTWSPNDGDVWTKIEKKKKLNERNEKSARSEKKA
jgi:hypothetical protein